VKATGLAALADLIRRSNEQRESGMKTSDRGVAMICEHEGFMPRAYDDFAPKKVLKPGDKVRGTLTIGYGSTGPHVYIGKEITEAEGKELLKVDLQTAESAVTKAVKVPLKQNEFDALVSFVFNVGGGAFRSSTLLKKLNAGDRIGAANEFERWNKSKGIELAGLTRRRLAERNLFTGA
jgi:lysozyme